MQRGGHRQLGEVAGGAVHATLECDKAFGEHHPDGLNGVERNAFRSLDMSRVRQIDLPDAASYRIISNHNPAFLTHAWGEMVRGSLEIRDAERFWESSRFLILVRGD